MNIFSVQKIPDRRTWTEIEIHWAKIQVLSMILRHWEVTLYVYNWSVDSSNRKSFFRYACKKTLSITQKRVRINQRLVTSIKFRMCWTDVCRKVCMWNIFFVLFIFHLYYLANWKENLLLCTFVWLLHRIQLLKTFESMQLFGDIVLLMTNLFLKSLKCPLSWIKVAWDNLRNMHKRMSGKVSWDSFFKGKFAFH